MRALLWTEVHPASYTELLELLFYGSSGPQPKGISPVTGGRAFWYIAVLGGGAPAVGSLFELLLVLQDSCAFLPIQGMEHWPGSLKAGVWTGKQRRII